MQSTNVLAINLALHNGKINKYNSKHFFARDEKRKQMLDAETEKLSLMIRRFFPKCNIELVLGFTDSKFLYVTDYLELEKLLLEDMTKLPVKKEPINEDFFSNNDNGGMA